MRLPMPPESVSELYGRSRGRCEHPDGCENFGQEIHHIAGRGGPDPHRLDNLLHLCRECHHVRVHGHPRESYTNGTMVSRHAPVAPHVRDGAA